MKIIKTLCGVLALILLCSCGAPAKNAFTPQTEIEADMEYISEEFCFCARLSCRSFNDISITVTSPENLAGMTVKTTENGVLASLNGIEYNFDSEQLGDRQGLSFALYALRCFIYKNCEYFETADGFAARCESPYGTLTGVCSSDGFLKSVSAENIGIVLKYGQQLS